MTSRVARRPAGAPRRLLVRLEAAVGPEAVISAPDELVVYECDAATLERFSPGAVVFPADTAQVAEVLRACHEEGVPFLPRGAGTGLSGGAVALDGAVVVALTRMKRIHRVDAEDGVAVVDPGVVNLHLSRTAEAHGLHFAPDPSSQGACTIGGNVAENAGGPHCLKHGATFRHVLGLEVVLPDGRVVEVGGEAADLPGYDLTGVLTGSEGTLGVVTRATVRLAPLPEAVRTALVVFDRVDDASRAVTGIIASGVTPAALEMLDSGILQALEEAFHVGLPLGAGALLLVEVDGAAAGLDRTMERVAEVCRAHGASEVRSADDPERRAALWTMRKRAFGAIGRVSPSYYTQDGVIPRTRLPEILRTVAEVGRRHGLRIANVFHAGDGNLHPCILFDERDREQTARVVQAGAEILRACVDAGGTLSGEHGIGLEKNDYMGWVFGPDDLDAFRLLRSAFDPAGICNPGKVLPSRRCVESSPRGRRAAL